MNHRSVRHISVLVILWVIIGRTLATQAVGEHESSATGLLPVQVKGKWGYIDREGQVRIQPRFDDAWDFSDGYAAVKVKDRWGFVDENGAMRITPRFDAVDSFGGGIAAVSWNDLWGFIDRSGNFILDPQLNK
jgi:WG containing repeat